MTLLNVDSWRMHKLRGRNVICQVNGGGVRSTMTIRPDRQPRHTLKPETAWASKSRNSGGIQQASPGGSVRIHFISGERDTPCWSGEMS